MFPKEVADVLVASFLYFDPDCHLPLIDQAFISKTLEIGRRAKDKASAEFASLSEVQLNWKPSPKSWSIAECLEHLIISNAAYFEVFQTIANGSYRMSFKERFSPLTSIWGRLMKDAMKETADRKMTTHKTLYPVSSHFTVDQVERYFSNCDKLFGLVSTCYNTDLDKTVITSPTLKFVTYTIRDAFTFLATHQHRHINQGIRVKNSNDFPE